MCYFPGESPSLAAYLPAIVLMAAHLDATIVSGLPSGAKPFHLDLDFRCSIETELLRPEAKCPSQQHQLLLGPSLLKPNQILSSRSKLSHSILLVC